MSQVAVFVDAGYPYFGAYVDYLTGGRPASFHPSCADLFRASRSTGGAGCAAATWMAGTSPAMTRWRDAVLRPSIRPGPGPGLLRMRKKEPSSRVAPAGGVSRDGPPHPTSSFRPERRRRGVEKPRARGCEVSPLRRAAHGSGRNDEGESALRAATQDEEKGTLIPSSPRRGRIEGRSATPHPSCPAPERVRGCSGGAALPIRADPPPVK